MWIRGYGWTRRHNSSRMIAWWKPKWLCGIGPSNAWGAAWPSELWLSETVETWTKQEWALLYLHSSCIPGKFVCIKIVQKFLVSLCRSETRSEAQVMRAGIFPLMSGGTFQNQVRCGPFLYLAVPSHVLQAVHDQTPAVPLPSVGMSSQ